VAGEANTRLEVEDAMATKAGIMPGTLLPLINPQTPETITITKIKPDNQLTMVL
jgi:hypothetical protein